MNTGAMGGEKVICSRCGRGTWQDSHAWVPSSVAIATMMTADYGRRISAREARLTADLKKGVVCTDCRKSQEREDGHRYDVPYLVAKRVQEQLIEVERTREREEETSPESVSKERLFSRRPRGIDPRIARLVAVASESEDEDRVPGRPRPNSRRMKQLLERKVGNRKTTRA